MSEYVFRDAPGYGCDMSDLMDGGRVTVGDYFASENTDHYGTLHEEIVRCRDCANYYEAEEYHPNGNYDRRCCKYFCTYDDEVSPDGFCSFGERKEGGDD